MLKRLLPTEDEQRVARLRKAWLASLGGVLVLLLLAVAWVGLRFSRVTPPTTLSFQETPDGTMSIDLTSTGALSPFIASGDPLFVALHHRAEVFFWMNGEEERWAMFVSFMRPGLSYRRKVKEKLEKNALLAPAEGETDAPYYFRMAPQGIIISNARDLPAFDAGIPRGSDPAGVAAYRSQGFCPAAWRTSAGGRVNSILWGSDKSVTMDERSVPWIAPEAFLNLP